MRELQKHPQSWHRVRLVICRARAQSPEAQAARPSKPKPSPALVMALAGSQPSSRILQAQAQAFNICGQSVICN